MTAGRPVAVEAEDLAGHVTSVQKERFAVGIRSEAHATGNNRLPSETLERVDIVVLSIES